ncbi:unnamed protein product [Clavelina lepadiformis]|uniref:Tonsoku-like protein n=1 Tax=Clavelina lepadiformis TaxID=159417 RepID=A0ABP0F2R9_CLALP
MDYSKEIKRYLKLRTKAQKDRNIVEESNCCNVLGDLYLKQENHEEALLMHTSELKLCEVLKDVTGQAIANRKIGDVYLALENYQRAIKHYKMYLRLAAQDSVELQRANTSLGRSYLEYSKTLENREESRKALQKSIGFLDESMSNVATLMEEGTVNKKEIIGMKIRSLLNLGLCFSYLSGISRVEDKNKSSTKSKDYLQKALYLSQRYEFDEERCLANRILTLVNIDGKQYSAAARSAECALQIARKIHRKDETLLALELASEAYLFMENLQAAKSYLKEIYKKYPKQRNEVEMKLKTVIKLYHLQKEIAASKENPQKEYSLHEALADAFCSIGSFYPAIKHYKMQEKLLPKLPNVSSKQRTAVYFSIASTLSDVKKYDEAICYYYKDIESSIEENELSKTFTHIAGAMEKNEASYEEIETIYVKALECADASKDDLLKLQTLVPYEEMQRNLQKTDKAFETRQKISELELKLGVIADEAMCENEDSQNSCFLQDIDELFEAEMTTNEDVEMDTMEDGDTSRRRRKTNFIKTNEKGETLLHRVCIEGKLKSVEVLVRQGHPLNPRDFCGWIPLHEACNHGHLDVVDFLVNNGAHINDTGGELCDNITPINDAATNGHFDVVKFLLRSGADPNIPNAHGNTTLDCLVNYYHRHKEDLDSDSKEEYKELLATLKSMRSTQFTNRSVTDLPQTVANYPEELKENNKILEFLDDDLPGLQKESLRISQASPEHGKLSDGEEVDDNFAIIEDFDDNTMDYEENYPNTLKSVANILKDAKSAKTKRFGGKCYSSNSAQSSSIGVDKVFLRYDKSRRNSRFVRTKRSERSGPFSSSFLPQSKNDCSELSRSATNRPTKQPALLSVDDDALSNDDWLVPDDEECAMDTQPVKRHRQSHEADVHKDTASKQSLDITSQPPLNSVSTMCVYQHTGASSTHFYPHPEHSQSSAIRLKVQISDKSFVIPVPGRDKKVSWLLETAASRYEKLTRLRPLLSLSTSDGCLLAPDDLICDTLTFNDTVVGNILSYKVLTISQCYVENCKTAKRPILPAILKACENCKNSKTFKLGNLGFSHERHLKPLIQSLGQEEVRKFILAGNRLDKDGVRCFCQSISQPSPEVRPPIEELDLTCCGLDSEAIGTLAECEPLHCLKRLNLSFNPLLNGDGMQKLLLSFKSLQSLVLKKCLISEDFFVNFDPAENSLPNLEHLDISKNDVGSYGLLKWLRLLNRTIIKRLHFREISNSQSNAYVVGHLLTFLGKSSSTLDFIDLSNNHLSTEQLDLLRPVIGLIKRIQT